MLRTEFDDRGDRRDEQRLRGPDVTGTAELGLESNPDLSHAWIVAFAPADDPQYAVSVVLTNVQSTADVAATGGRLAGPIAKGMLDFLLTGPGSTPTPPPPPTTAPATGGG